MTFLAQETSVEAGRPVELYTFTLALSTFRLTSAEDDQVVGGETYQAIAISRGRFSQAAEPRSATLTIEMPADHELPSRYVASAPSERARVVIQRFHRADGELATIFDGRLKSVAFERDGRVAKVAVEPAITAVSRQIPRFSFGRPCQNVLGDGFGAGATGLCDVNLDVPTFRLQAVVTAASGLTVTIPGAAAYGNGWFNGGTIRTSAGVDARLVISQVGDVVTLHIAFPFSLVGQTATLRAGCDRSIEVCSSKFNKVDRFQGYAYVPRLNPFEGLLPEAC